MSIRTIRRCKVRDWNAIRHCSMFPSAFLVIGTRAKSRNRRTCSSTFRTSMIGTSVRMLGVCSSPRSPKTSICACSTCSRRWRSRAGTNPAVRQTTLCQQQSLKHCVTWLVNFDTNLLQISELRTRPACSGYALVGNSRLRTSLRQMPGLAKITWNELCSGMQLAPKTIQALEVFRHAWMTTASAVVLPADDGASGDCAHASPISLVR